MGFVDPKISKAWKIFPKKLFGILGFFKIFGSNFRVLGLGLRKIFRLLGYLGQSFCDFWVLFGLGFLGIWVSQPNPKPTFFLGTNVWKEHTNIKQQILFLPMANKVSVLVCVPLFVSFFCCKKTYFRKLNLDLNQCWCFGVWVLLMWNLSFLLQYLRQCLGQTKNKKIQLFKGHREQLNILSAFLDGSGIYGSNSARAGQLRTMVGGKSILDFIVQSRL